MVQVHDPIIDRQLSPTAGRSSISWAADPDREQHLVVLCLMGFIALVVAFVIGLALWSQSQFLIETDESLSLEAPEPGSALGIAGRAANPDEPPVAQVTETVKVTIPKGAGIRVENGVVLFYFARNSADLAPGAAKALAAVIQGVEAGHHAVISGYHDLSGDAQVNEALARRRAETVRDVLVGLGVEADRLRMERPATTEGGGNDAQARRVEVRLVD